MRIIRLAQQPVESDPTPPGQCPTCTAEAWHKWGRPKTRKIVDVTVTEITTQRYRCKNCRKTVTARPKGVGRSGRSHAFMALIGVLYALGLSSHRGVETTLGLFGHSVDHVSSWRDIQKLGKAVKRRLPEGKVRVVGVDETWVRDQRQIETGGSGGRRGRKGVEYRVDRRRVRLRELGRGDGR